jgi:Na+-transporting NADH:ubiquinone oxidoreductase subunit NqrF
MVDRFLTDLEHAMAILDYLIKQTAYRSLTYWIGAREIRQNTFRMICYRRLLGEFNDGFARYHELIVLSCGLPLDVDRL